MTYFKSDHFNGGSSVKDPDGKFLIYEMMALARRKSSGWTKYNWSDPLTKKFEEKPY